MNKSVNVILQLRANLS